MDQFVNNMKTVIPETQESPSNPTPLATSPAELLFPEEQHSTPSQKPIDILSSLHSTPVKPPLPNAKPKESCENTVIPNKLAGLSRRKGMSFLSQLTEKKTEQPMESGYSRTWKLPRKAITDNEKEVSTRSKQNEAPKKPVHKPSQKKKTATQTVGRKKAQPNVLKKAEKQDNSDSDVENETTALVDHVKSLLSTPKYKLTESINSSPISTNSESDDDSPNIMAFQQAVTSIF